MDVWEVPVSSCPALDRVPLMDGRPTRASQSALRARADIHEEASVKTGARRLRDFPDIHSASPAAAGRHETFCGCSHSHQRRRTAPCRTSGCNLSPALDLDSEALHRTGQPGCSSRPGAMPGSGHLHLVPCWPRRRAVRADRAQACPAIAPGFGPAGSARTARRLLPGHARAAPG